MKPSYIKPLSILFFSIALLAACRKNDYYIEKGVHDPHVNMSTYDFLQSKSPMFDSLLKAVNYAGLAGQLKNNSLTFFAMQNVNFATYLEARGLEGITSLPAEEWKIKLNSYIFPLRKIERDSLNTGNLFFPNQNGEQMIARLELIRNAQDNVDNVTKHPLFYLIILKVVGTPDDPAPAGGDDIRAKCQTTGILTNNGVLHVLDRDHYLLF